MYKCCMRLHQYKARAEATESPNFLYEKEQLSTPKYLLHQAFASDPLALAMMESKGTPRFACVQAPPRMEVVKCSGGMGHSAAQAWRLASKAA
eukprot:13668219-Alexandrium_andersonii.AAC.1